MSTAHHPPTTAGHAPTWAKDALEPLSEYASVNGRAVSVDYNPLLGQWGAFIRRGRHCPRTFLGWFTRPEYAKTRCETEARR